MTPPGIDSGTFRLVGQHLNHYASIECMCLISRYGSDLVLVESFAENNYTAGLATRSIGPGDRNGQHYWLGLASLDDLRTNTLESAAGLLVSQYAGIIYLYIF